VISIVDYGLGNLASIAKMLDRVGAECNFVRTPEAVLEATSLILPGVGAFDHGMSNLRARGLVEPLTAKVKDEGTPLLGLCLGMHLLTHGSEEGKLPGLGWIQGRCVRFRSDASSPIKIPHMGWNNVRIVREHALVHDLGENPRFYFVHAYYASGLSEGVEVARATHGQEFPAIIAKGNIAGVQFHPEKSHTFGMKLLTRFAESSGAVTL